MSLQVWLPLDGNLNNQGLSELKFNYTGSNIVVNTNGKIGSCYYRNTTAADAIISNMTIDLGTQQSMFCWLKMETFNSSSNLTGILGQHRYANNTGMGITIRYASATTGYLSVNTGNGSARTYNSYYGTTVLQAGEWYHIGFTYDGSNIRLYVNGVLEKIQAYTNMSCPADYLFIGNWSLNGTSGTTINNYSSKNYINDVRIYDHCLSSKEVKEISKGLVLYYPLDNNEDAGETNIVYDCSGYGHHGTMYNNITFENSSARNSKAIHFNATNQYIRVTGLHTTGFSDSYSIAWWGKSSTFNGVMHWGFSDGVRLNGIYNGTLWNTGDSSNNPLYVPGTTTQVTAPTTGVWHHFVMTGNGTKCYVYKDGVLWGEAKTYKTITGTTIVFNGWDTGTSYSLSNLSLSDWRLYSTALSAADVLELYNTSAIIDNMQNLYAYEFIENDTNEVYKTGVFETSKLFENGIELLHYDKNIYTELDGSKWIHVAHHNNPANGVFGSTGPWQSGYYIDTNRWYDLEQAIQIMPIYEFMLKQKTTSDATETKWRWTQTVDPMTATWTTVQPGTVTFNTSSGYSSSSYGGLYYRNGNNQRMCIANASNGNWYGGIGVWTAYQGGIPGYPNTTVTSGYVDLYLRIFPDMAIYKDGHITSNSLYEI